MGRVTRCTNCGAENESGAVFCVACGHFLEWTDPQPVKKQPPPPDRPSEPELDVVLDPMPAPKPEPRPIPAPAPAPPPTPAAPGPARPARQSPPPDGPVPDIIAAIDAGRDLATARGRSDLDAHLGQTRQRLAAKPVTVVVVGEFKRGKSTLVNALLQHAVCPVDADVVTAVPTMVRYADQPRVHQLRPDRGRRPDRRGRGVARPTCTPWSPRRPTRPTRSGCVRSRSACRTGCCGPGCAWSTPQGSAGWTPRTASSPSARSAWPRAPCSSPTPPRS